MKYSQIPSDQFDFYTRKWSPSGEPVATVVFVHGFAEHCDRYDHVFREVADSGVDHSLTAYLGFELMFSSRLKSSLSMVVASVSLRHSRPPVSMGGGLSNLQTSITL